jgi:hypothetical protein
VNKGFQKGYIPWNKIAKLPKKICLICGKSFYDLPCKLKFRKYCSQECVHLAKKQNARWINKVCIICNKKFKVRFAKRNQKYCSRNCYYAESISKESNIKRSKTLKGRIITQETREKMSKAQKGRIFNEITKKRMSESRKKLFENKEFLRKQRIIMNLKPNKIENILNNILQKYFPNEYKYVGDFTFTLGRKCPDFMNINGQKKLIELFGDYWHRNDDPQNRINHFKQYGFDTLIIWEHELKNENILISKLKEFHFIEDKSEVTVNG